MRTSILLILLLFNSLLLNAQIGFQEHIVIDLNTPPDAPRHIASADLNGDDKIDLVVCSYSDHMLVWFESVDGSGHFRIKKIISSEIYAYSFQIADIDGDGDSDILVPDYSGEILWFENLDGTGIFGDPHIVCSNIYHPLAIHVSDIDGDGDLDIVSAEGQGLNWYENLDGLGNFSDLQYVSGLFVNEACAIFSADMDGDNDMDVVAAVTPNTICWIENMDGQGMFNGWHLTITNDVEEVTSIHVDDLDGDGDQDVLSSSYIDDKIAWYENLDGLGTFGPQEVIADYATETRSVYAADLDGDDDLDVLAASLLSNSLIWFKNLDGNATFSPMQAISPILEIVNPSCVRAVDLDGDDDLDVISSGFENNNVVWLDNDGQGNFGEVKDISSVAWGASKIYAVDFDSDGDLDLLSGSYTLAGSKVAWYENFNGLGYLNTQYIISEDLDYARSFHAADIDSDGDMDVVVPDSHDDHIILFRNMNGSGNTFEESFIDPSIDGPSDVKISDIDGDGDMDVLSCGFVSPPNPSNYIAWHENMDGMGETWSTHFLAGSTETPLGVNVADIDGDGDNDVLVASYGDNKAAWYENTDGQGNFDDQQIISSTAPGAMDIYASDLDGDNDLDVVIAGSKFIYDEGILVWFENTDGAGNFGDPHILIYDERGANSVVTADLDDDGDQDILYSTFDEDPANSKVAWLENIDGQANFGGLQIVTTEAIDVKSVFAFDMDGDGDMDIASASRNDSKVAWYENINTDVNEIWGNIILDVDGSGCENTDPGFPNLMVTTDNGSESITTFTAFSGIYQLFPQSGSYTTHVSLPEYFTVDPDFYVSDFTGFGNVDTANFCIQTTETINDLYITVYPEDFARPGFESTYLVIYGNAGTTQLSGNILFEFEGSKMDFVSSNIPPSNQTVDLLEFEYTDLFPFFTRSFYITFSIFPPPTVEIGDELNFASTIYPVEGDNNEEDNVSILNQTVVGSYDPNDIVVLEGEQILLEDIDEYLHYIIRFQNTGTAYALFVEIKNLLHENLDWSTLQMESASHDYTVEIINGNNLTFTFSGIYLPDSTTNEPESHGYIAYRVKPRQDLVVGDLITNYADIYFDFNPPIETNIVATEIVDPTGIKIHDIIHKDIVVYPIPTTGILHVISHAGINNIEVYNNLGKKILTSSNQRSLDISNLDSGIYYFKVIINEGNTVIRKIVKH